GPNARLQSLTHLNVLSHHENRFNNIVISGIERPEGGKKPGAAAVAFGVSVIENHVLTVIRSGAELDAGLVLSIRAEKDEPIATGFRKLLGLLDGFKFGDLVSGLFGLVSYKSALLNSWASSGAQADTVGVAGSVSVVVHLNENRVILEDGVRLNQLSAFQTAAQTVRIEADTRHFGTYMAGIFGLELGRGLKMFTKKDPWAVLNPFGAESGKGGVGGSFNVFVLTQRTEVRIGRGVQIFAGQQGGIDIRANTRNFILVLGQSGGRAGQFGVSGTFTFALQDSETRVRISDGVVFTAGWLNIVSRDDTLMINLAGSVILGNSIGFGVTISINIVTRTAETLLGFLGGGTALPGTLTVDGSFTHAARLDGKLYAFSVAAAKISPPAANKPPNSGKGIGDSNDDPLDGISLPNLFNEGGDTGAGDSTKQGKAGVGISGDVSVNIIIDRALAEIRGPYTVMAGDLLVEAHNDTDLISASGSAAIVTAGKTSVGL
ncbi:MAG: hypothetical protein P5672_24690, partial [Limnospira sp. PMC 1234.20]